ncbi:uncharacterized protein LOC106655844 isoform X2 [Trichogramma pretiosum]|uniref:uncharacterized protein LOC106655844 isoform X2 n=1 Tax=Trichogramma pretiosum TaxID=7493 RepID=UPI0006C97CB8|nr:uncharacterized protein LOC106655844 isoform X2 [Trichogramma pretiosum]
MQSSQNHDASEFEVDIQFHNQNGNPTFRDFSHTKYMQLKTFYKTKRKYFFIGIIIAVLIIMDIINFIKKDGLKETEYETASTQKTVRDESFSSEMNMVTVNYKNASIDFEYNLQEAEFNNSLLLLEGNTLWQLNLKTEDIYHWHESKNVITAFYFNFQNIPIWFEDQSKTTHSLIPEYDGLPFLANFKVEIIVDDYYTGNSYALDEKGGNLFLFDKNYHYSAVILTDLKNATDLKIDPSVRLIFILANGDILRYNMDGRSLKALKFLRKDVSAFTLDYMSKKIYSLGKTAIEYTDYEGKIRKVFHKFEAFHYKSSLIFQNNKLFWIQYDRFPTTPEYIIFCEIIKKCQMTFKIPILFQQSKFIDFPNKPVTSLDTNPCQRSPPVCDHICILSVNYSYTCACDQFHQLSDDMKTCKLMPYFIYVHNLSFRGKFITNSFSSSNDLIPFQPVYFDSKVKLHLQKILFAKGSKNSEIFVSDDENMYSINLRNAEQNKLFTVAGQDRIILSFTYDSKVKRLYVLVDNTKTYNSYLRTYNTDMVFVEFELQLCYRGGFSSMTIISNELLLLSYLKTGEILQFNTLASRGREKVNSEIGRGNKILLLPKIPADVNSLKFNWLSFNGNITTWNYGSKFDDEFTIELKMILPSTLSNVNKGFIYEENLYVEANHSIWRVQKNSSISANILFKITEDIYGITLI